MKLTGMELSSHVDIESPIANVVLVATIITDVPLLKEWQVNYRPDMTVVGLARGLEMMAGMLRRFARDHDIE